MSHFSPTGDSPNRDSRELTRDTASFYLSYFIDVQDTESTACSSTEKKTGEIIQDNENLFSFRGQIVFIISHNHSWLPFNAGLAVFMDRKILVSKQWKILVLQVVGEVTTAHWCIVCFIAASSRIQKMYSLSRSPLCIVPLLDRQKHCVVIHCHNNLKGAICEHTHRQWMASSVSRFHCSLSDDLWLQETLQIPVGIQAHLPMPAGRQGTSKCAARCASPAQWDIHCTDRQRGSASPMGPGRADNRSVNVRKSLKCLCDVMYETVGEECIGVIERGNTHILLHTYTFKGIQLHSQRDAWLG